jgi:environmental stress-induced protein Ves
MIGGVRRLPLADYRAMPWRNGAGVTLEIARDGIAEHDFAWRLSLATVAASGPFSVFAGYRRAVTLISGNGFRLDITAQPPATLDVMGATAVFAGDVATQCTLIDGPCRDLSLMVRQPGHIAAVSRLDGDCALMFNRAPSNALFCLQGSALLKRGEPPAGRAAAMPAVPAVASAAMQAVVAAPAVTTHELSLETHDTLLVEWDDVPWTVRSLSAVPAAVLLMSWKVAGR